MNQQNNPVPNKQQSLIDELSVTEAQAAEVKGGDTYIKTVRFKPGKDSQDQA